MSVKTPEIKPKPNFLKAVKDKFENLFERSNFLILWNDNSVYYLNVINGLQNVLNYSSTQAYDMTVKVHNEGKGVVFTGDKDKCENYKQQLSNYYGLTVTIE